jgi:hypothetical protein
VEDRQRWARLPTGEYKANERYDGSRSSPTDLAGPWQMRAFSSTAMLHRYVGWLFARRFGRAVIVRVAIVLLDCLPSRMLELSVSEHGSGHPRGNQALAVERDDGSSDNRAHECRGWAVIAAAVITLLAAALA